MFFYRLLTITDSPHLDDAPAVTLGLEEELRGETEHFAEPVHGHHLQLSAGGARDPGEADAGDGPGQDVGHDGGVAVGRGEVGVELNQRMSSIK